MFPSFWDTLINTNSFSCFPVDLTPGAIISNYNYIPFPIIQGYSAYTSKLDAMGADFFSHKEKSPMYIIIGGDAIEQRNIITDTPQTWNAIFQNYSALEKTSKRILMKKKPYCKSPINVCPLLNGNDITIGEWHDIPTISSNQFVSIYWKPSFKGKLWKLFYRDTQYSLSLQYEDGTIYRMRIIPELLQGPIPLSKIPPQNQINTIFENRKIVKIKLNANDQTRMQASAKIKFYKEEK